MKKLNKQAVLFIICGQVGAGKTTTANLLSKMTHSPVASVDSTLINILPKPSFVGKDNPPTKTELTICYNTFALLAKYLLSSGNSIIIDGAFAKNSQRKLLINVAKKYRCPYHVLYIYCPSHILHKRAVKRFSKGKGVGWKAHQKIKKVFEPLKIPHTIINTSKNVSAQLRQFLKHL